MLVNAISVQAVGLRVNLENSKINLKHQQITKLALANLMTNSAEVAIHSYEIESLPQNTFKEKVHLLWMHATNNTRLYKDVAIAVALLTVAFTVAVVAAIALGSYLNTLYNDILHGRLVYNDSHFGGFSHERVGFDYYYQQAIVFWGMYGVAVPLVGALLIHANFTSITKLKTSLENFFNDPCRLTCTQSLVDSSYSINDTSDLSNTRTDTTVQDPISLDDLKTEWIHAPRFIKIGSYVFTLAPLLKQIFSKPLVAGLIGHPLENRSLSVEEQEKFTTDLAQLFAFDKNEIIRFWDPYYCSFAKMRVAGDPRVMNVSVEERPTVIEDLLFEESLAAMFPSVWGSLRRDQIGAIKNNLRNEFFGVKRLEAFFNFVPSEILETEIKINDSDSYTLKGFLHGELNRSLEVSYPV